MLFMVIYTWEPGQRNELVRRRIEKGKLIREGVKLLGEWTDIGGGRAFSLVESNDAKAFMSGTNRWGDLMKVEAVPVIDTEELMKWAKGRKKA